MKMYIETAVSENAIKDPTPELNNPTLPPASKLHAESLLLQEMLQLGCSKESLVLHAFQTYLELCECYILKDVDYHFSKKMDLMYLTAREDEETEVYVPVYVKEDISPKWLNLIQKCICAPRNTKTFNLVIRDSDTTHVVFRVSKGLIPPLSPEDVKIKKKEEEEKEMMSNELQRLIPELYAKACEDKTKV